MIKNQIKLSIALIVLVLAISSLSIVASADDYATPDEIEASIVQGLTWLASQQNGDGSWGYWTCDYVASTAP
ncbi:MAG TPA: hypothetical protein VLE70_17235 [Anaerolineae bacterium]|nr:hypothetical protein [Anaerolineae bacterium]